MYPQTVSLDGEWGFYYIPQKFDPERDVLPEKEKFTGRILPFRTMILF